MKCCSKLWKKPWSWLHVAKHCSYDDSPPLQSVVCVLSVSVAFVQLVEDPVTQIVDLLVIVIGGLHLQNHKLNSNCIAQPWNHTFCHPRSTVTLWSEGVWIPQLPQNTPPSSHTRPRYSPAPCVRLHAQHYQLLAEMHFFLFFFFLIWHRRIWAFPALPSDLSWSPLWIYAHHGRPALLPVEFNCSKFTYMHNTQNLTPHAPPPKKDYWDTFWCLYLFIILVLMRDLKDEMMLRGPQISYQDFPSWVWNTVTTALHLLL